MVKLARRFNWQDLDTVYFQIDEDRDVEPVGSGKYRFTCEQAINKGTMKESKMVAGKKYVGVAYESTVAAMCDYPFWKLKTRITNAGKEVSDVVEVKKKPLKGES